MPKVLSMFPVNQLKNQQRCVALISYKKKSYFEFISSNIFPENFSYLVYTFLILALFVIKDYNPFFVLIAIWVVRGDVLSRYNIEME